MDRMPTIFFGHGSPMNAIEDNDFSRTWAGMGARLPKPRAILCVSAHWLTEGSPVTAAPTPRTIHDFGGFPRELYGVEYPAPGSIELAQEVRKLLGEKVCALDETWGLDHGTWSVLRRVYPAADIPIVQLGIDIAKGGAYHYELASRLAPLRDNGVLVVGSGNIVHNLGMVDWDRLGGESYGYDWALEINETFKNLVAAGRDDELIDYAKLGKAARLAIPTPDHYYPFLYFLALRDRAEKLEIFNDAAVGGSLTMTSFLAGA